MAWGQEAFQKVSPVVDCDSMPLGVVVMGGVGGNSGREGNCGIFPCAFFRSLNLDLVLLGKAFTLSTTWRNK